MGFFSKKKNNGATEDITEMKVQLYNSENEKQFYFNAVRSLLVFIKQFPLNLKEIDTTGFVQKIDDIIAELLKQENISRQESFF